MVLDRDLIRRAPKVLLHDHLDGGVRPGTLVELAAETGYDRLPSDDPAEVRAAMVQDGEGFDLERYLRAFEHTVAVMQTPGALRRVAAECAEDLAADGIVYAEVRFAPERHLAGGLDPDGVVSAVLEGLEEGSSGTPLVVRTVLTAMRTTAVSREIAELAVDRRDDGVVGFDIAGAEAGHPPTRHLDAFQHVRRNSFHITIHAGEGYGLPSIWEALNVCGAERLGHGVRLVDDITPGTDGRPARLGRLAAYVRDRRIPLEVCPTSNVHTGIAPSVAEHPVDLLTRLRFRVTVNTDNRLMSDVTLTDELAALSEAFGYGIDELRWLTVNAMKSAFHPYDQRRELIDEVIVPGWRELPDAA